MITPFYRELQAVRWLRGIEIVGPMCIYLRVAESFADSNLLEFSPDGGLVPQYTDMLKKATRFAVENKMGLRSDRLLAHRFIVRLRGELDEEQFEEMIECQRREFDKGEPCPTYEYLDPNVLMLQAGEDIGLYALDPTDTLDRQLMDRAWTHARRRMSQM